MSTDAFFFFHMDPENKRGESSTQVHQQYQHQPTASTSSSSVVSRQQFLVEYSPKPTTRVAPVPQTLPAPVQQSTATAQHQAIHRWLANHRSYSYLPHDDAPEHSAFSDDEDEESEDGYSSTSEESSDSEEDDDQIYMAPRRQHSAPLISSVVPPVALPVAVAVARRAWPLSAARPAMPVVDRAEATAFTTLQDKSHWSDDEDDLFEDEEEEVVEEAEEWIDEDDLPALDADSGAPASTSTRSLPIPIFAPPRTRSNPILSSRKSRLEDAWDAASPHRAARKMIQDGQSFWTPWISDYIAAQNN